MPRQKDPTWQYVLEIPGESDSESPRLQCQFCKGNFCTTITRMKSHLGKIACRDIQICQCVPDSVVNEVREHIEMATAKKAKRSQCFSPFGSSAGSSSTPIGPSNPQAQGQHLIHSMLPPVTPNTQSTIYTLVKKKEKEETDNCIMEAIVDCCLPFNVLRNKTFQLAIERVANHGPGYKLPSFETARTKLLGGLKERADDYVKSVRKNWEMTGCTVMSDGWTDRRNRPHLNLLVASPHGTVFVKSICTTGKRKDASYIADFIIGAIEEHIGAQNVVQVIADNASNYTAAGVIIERKWPHLFKTNCAAHCIDLMLEDIDKIDYVQPIMDNARRITKFMYKFQHVNDLMKKYTHDVELKRPGATRFATQFLCLQSVLKQEEPLRFMIASNDWKELPQSKTTEGLEIASIILGVSFWGEGKEIVKVVEPLVRVLRLVDSEGSTLGYLYEAMDMVKEAIKVIYKDQSSKWKTLWDIIDRRWNGLLHSPIHAAAAYLNPPLMLNGRVKFTDQEVKKGMDEVFRRMVPEEGQDVVYEQFGHYFRKSKEIFDKMALQLLTSVHPRLWWEMCGNLIPYVRDVAIKLLSQPCSASACERTWSAFEATHTKKRNRLGPSKLHDLVYVKLNLSLQKTSEEKLEADSKPIFIDHIVAFPDGGEVNELNGDEDDDDEDAEDEDVDAHVADVDPFAYLNDLEVE